MCYRMGKLVGRIIFIVQITITITITIAIIAITISYLRLIQTVTGHTKAWSKTISIITIKEYYRIITITIITPINRGRG